MADYSLSGYRSYARAFNLNHATQSFSLVWDQNWVYENGNGNGTVSTGAWRPLFPSDLAPNINVSGLNVTVGAVAITGSPVVTLTGNQNVNIVNPILAVSGNLSASISSVAITGSPTVTLTGIQTVNVNSVPTWNKVSSTGYRQSFSPFVGPTVIQSIMGVSKTTGNGGFGYLQIFDNTDSGSNLIASIAVQSGAQNFFMDFDGTQFGSGFTVVTSLDPVTTQIQNPDFFCTILYK